MSKLVILDLDGTLLRNDKTVSSENINTLLEFKSKGNKILFATARPPRDAYKYVPEVLRDNPIICYNGACIIDKSKTILYSKQIGRESVLATLKLFKENNYNNLCLEINDKLYSNFDTSYFFGNAPTTIVDLENLKFDKAYKVIVCSKEPISSQLLAKLPYECKGVITDNGTLCQIMQREATKWTSIKAILEDLQINVSDTIAFGDDYNDIDMIKNCGFGVAMGNAEDIVKQNANFVTDTNINDGVANYIKSKLI